MKNISENISNILWTQGIIQEEDVERCKYGLNVFLSSFVEILSILLMSIIVGNFVETILFFTAFIPLRVYAGGYHADTKLKCYIISVMAYMIFAGVMCILPESLYLITCILCTMLSFSVVIISSPIIHYNKNVNEIERKNYRKISVVICLFDILVVFIMFSIAAISKFSVSVALGQFAVTVSMIAALLKERILRKK